ncbi:hypothetical protein V8C37DRAFT_281370 [Trichoderma ceciliae]
MIQQIALFQCQQAPFTTLFQFLSLAASNCSMATASLLPRRLSSNRQQWYHSRAVERQPVLEIRSVEAGQLEADNDSSFPIPVYTSSIALQCNIAYYVSSRRPLSRKPRLLRPSSRQRHLSSLSWHAQRIGGTATRNDFAEQWDTTNLIAGLLC